MCECVWDVGVGERRKRRKTEEGMSQIKVFNMKIAFFCFQKLMYTLLEFWNNSDFDCIWETSVMHNNLLTNVVKTFKIFYIL